MASIDDFAYVLPEERIAQTPLADRADARLLVDRGSAPPEHHRVRELASLLKPGDLVVVNTTRVLPARVIARRPTGGSCEILLLNPEGPIAAALAEDESRWHVLVRPSRKIEAGT